MKISAISAAEILNAVRDYAGGCHLGTAVAVPRVY